MKFPHWYYHKTEKARIVKDPSELEALGAGWATHPDLIPAEPAAPAEEPEAAEDVKPKGRRNANR